VRGTVERVTGGRVGSAGGVAIGSGRGRLWEEVTGREGLAAWGGAIGSRGSTTGRVAKGAGFSVVSGVGMGRVAGETGI